MQVGVPEVEAHEDPRPVDVLDDVLKSVVRAETSFVGERRRTAGELTETFSVPKMPPARRFTVEEVMDGAELRVPPDGPNRAHATIVTGPRAEVSTHRLATSR